MALKAIVNGRTLRARSIGLEEWRAIARELVPDECDVCSAHMRILQEGY